MYNRRRDRNHQPDFRTHTPQLTLPPPKITYPNTPPDFILFLSGQGVREVLSSRPFWPKMGKIGGPPLDIFSNFVKIRILILTRGGAAR